MDYKKLWEILKCTTKRWYEDTDLEKMVREKSVYKDLLEYMEIIEEWNKEKESEE